MEKSEDEKRKRFSANDVFIFTHSYTRHQSLIQTSAHEFEPLFYTSYQYPSQLEFNLFFFVVLFVSRAAHNKTDVWCNGCRRFMCITYTHMSNISAMALEFFKICHDGGPEWHIYMWCMHHSFLTYYSDEKLKNFDEINTKETNQHKKYTREERKKRKQIRKK